MSAQDVERMVSAALACTHEDETHVRLREAFYTAWFGPGPRHGVTVCMHACHLIIVAFIYQTDWL